jgi:hypothetical protein
MKEKLDGRGKVRPCGRERQGRGRRPPEISED